MDLASGIYAEEGPMILDADLETSLHASDVLDLCTLPSLHSIAPQLACLLVCAHLFRLTSSLGTNRHAVSAVLGITVLYVFVGFVSCCMVVGVSLAFYVMMRTFPLVLKAPQIRPYVLSAAVLASVTCLEFSRPCRTWWMQVRGVTMVIGMKVVSTAFDRGERAPGLLEFFGYCLCPAGVVFGPWLPLEEYNRSLSSRGRRFGVRMATRTAWRIALALAAFSVSSCWGYFLVPDTAARWLVIYREAASFRLSHYFVSLVGEAGMMSAGLGEGSAPDEWDYKMTSPWLVELPRSLNQVVVHWNYPMHAFLKTYVYRRLKLFGGQAQLLGTFLFSSVFHGLNRQLSAVLLSLGYFAYVELALRRKLAEALRACVLPWPCGGARACRHRCTSQSALALALNTCFSALAIFNLAYLGSIMEEASNPDAEEASSMFARWLGVGFAGHLLMVLLHLVARVLPS